jgi:hypothetical protein
MQLLRRHGADPWHPTNTEQTPVGTARLIGNSTSLSSSLTSPTPTRKRNPQVLTIAQRVAFEALKLLLRDPAHELGTLPASAT